LESSLYTRVKFYSLLVIVAYICIKVNKNAKNHCFTTKNSPIGLNYETIIRNRCGNNHDDAGDTNYDAFRHEVHYDAPSAGHYTNRNGIGCGALHGSRYANHDDSEECKCKNEEKEQKKKKEEASPATSPFGGKEEDKKSDKGKDTKKKSDKGKTEKKRKNRKLKMKRISIRFDQRSFKFEKKESKLTPYWLILSTIGVKSDRISLPVQLGKKQIEKLENGWRPSSVEMVKKNGQWFAHITIEKWIKFKEPKTIIGIDIGEVNFAAAMAIRIDNQEKYMKGQIWRGEEIKRIRGLYGHIRRSLGRKKLPKKIKEIGQKENRKVNQEVHIIGNDIIEYAKQFEDPIIAMEDLTNIRYSFDKGKKLNKRFHSLPFYKLRKYIEYKSNKEGIDVRFIEPFDTTKTCHRCGNVSSVYDREYICSKCGMVYNRDLNSSINIAHFLMREINSNGMEEK